MPVQLMTSVLEAAGPEMLGCRPRDPLAPHHTHKAGMATSKCDDKVTQLYTKTSATASIVWILEVIAGTAAPAVVTLSVAGVAALQCCFCLSAATSSNPCSCALPLLQAVPPSPPTIVGAVVANNVLRVTLKPSLHPGFSGALAGRQADRPASGARCGSCCGHVHLPATAIRAL